MNEQVASPVTPAQPEVRTITIPTTVTLTPRVIRGFLFSLWIAALLALMVWMCVEAAWVFGNWTDDEFYGDENRIARIFVGRIPLLALLFFALMIVSFVVRSLAVSRRGTYVLLAEQQRELTSQQEEITRLKSLLPQN